MILIISLFLACPAIAKPVSTAGSSKLQNRIHNIQDNEARFYKAVEKVTRKIDRAAKTGNPFTHVMVNICGHQDKRLVRYFRSLGYKAKVDYVGIRGVHYQAVITVSWLGR